MPEQQFSQDISGIIRRRKKGFVFVFLLVLIAAVVVSMVLPPVYRSETTILIEGQQIPADYIQSTVTSFVEERLQTIKQQVMSRTKLTEIINQFNLYSDMKDRYTTEEIVAKMREDIQLLPISADVADKKGRAATATIAFKLSYEGKEPSTVQRVANVLASLYLEENMKSRAQRATNTTEFFQSELASVNKTIETLAQKISQYKAEHIGELPEYNAINQQTVQRLNQTLDQTDLQIRNLQERKVYLEGQLATIDPLRSSVSGDGRTIVDPAERLKYLRIQLGTLQSTLSDKHPDVVKVKNEIRQLEGQTSAIVAQQQRGDRLRELKAQYTELTGRLGEKHPQVMQVKREMDAVSQEIESARKSNKTLTTTADAADNPAYISIRTQIAAAEIELKNLDAEKGSIKQKIQEYQDRIERAPAVEKEYNTLIRDYDAARGRFNEVTQHYTEARTAQEMEETQKGERFTIVEPAQLPENPFKPNRIAIVLIGLFLAIGSGAGYAAGREALDNSIKTPLELNELTALPLLSVVTFLETGEERRSRRLKAVALIVAILVLIGAALAAVHIFLMPLDVLWFKVLKRIS